MSTTAVQVASATHDNASKQASHAVFYSNSGIFNLSGKCIGHGQFDTVSARRIQASLAKDQLLLVVDLADTWIRPFTSTAQIKRVIDSILDRVPFIITRRSIYFVAYSPAVKIKKMVVGDLDVVVLDRKTAKSKILSALGS
ncbi:MAG: hypothetical protein ACYCOU_09865 [Sulfobacillus sp.]